MTDVDGYYRRRANGYRKQALMRQAQQAERYVQVGMRAAIRDMQEFINDPDNVMEIFNDRLLDAAQLNAYLLAMLITTGGYDEEPDDGQS